ncbi:3-isopropylmalate dehydratase large subunit [uncultured Veillonella sp.]|uniref:3-isopropylmalate dehydratase large subunit n=1 Tax=uncultured Veillonella sp. TaxID=159268 RepID=UPI002635F4F9|nr:3-isopropylmalate dehydratase large subunit [uncultured Veillonella sp.]
MGMTITEKNMARHAGVAEVKAGQIVECQLDAILMNDITFPPALKEFRKIGKPVFDTERIYLVPDHFTPNKDIKSAEQAKIMRDFVRETGITHYFEVGRMGIEHVLLPEQGLVAPGDMIIGADSHTCTYGALGAFATGVGSTDAGVAMAMGKTWFKVPETIKVELVGQPNRWVTGKDIVLELIGRIGVDGARYKALEFTGSGVAHMTMADRLTICNMAIEAGGKCGVFPYDAVTEEYVTGRVTRQFTPLEADPDAVYCEHIIIDLGALQPVVAFPHLPSNTHYINEIAKDITIDQVVIGSCTNGRYEDLEAAASIFKGKKVADFVRCIVVPGSQAVYDQAIKSGLVDIFVAAGCAVSTPTCGPCLGGYMGIMAAGERTVSTTNRNFRGRMGHVDSEVYLASPYVAAASAILGRIAGPEEVGAH